MIEYNIVNYQSKQLNKEQAINDISILQSAESSYADRVSLLIIQRGNTKKWLADQLGITKQALNMVLKRNKKPKFVNEIAEVFNVSPHWLLTGEGSVTLTQTNNLVNSRAVVYNLSSLLQDNQYIINPLEVHTKPELDAFCIFVDLDINKQFISIPNNAILVLLRGQPIQSDSIALIYDQSIQKIVLFKAEKQTNNKLNGLIFVPDSASKKVSYDIKLESEIKVLGVLDEIRLKI